MVKTTSFALGTNGMVVCCEDTLFKSIFAKALKNAFRGDL